MAFKIGIDVGNSDTKTQHTTTPSGYKVQKMKPCMASEWIEYDGEYYVPTKERFAYSMDKTENGHALILSLFGIAKEILHAVKQKYEYEKVPTQELINQFHNISIGVGLPPGHFDLLAKKTKEYYWKVFGDGICFVYNDLQYRLKLNAVSVFPQDFMAVWKNPASKFVSDYDMYYIIGIGGYTVDIIFVQEGKVEAGRCSSIPLGTTVLYDNIIREALKEGSALSSEGIERVLRGKNSILNNNEKILHLIKTNAQMHVENIIDSCMTAGVKFSEAPIIYFGGGCLLLREYLENNKNVVQSEFIEDVNANAYYYAQYISE